MAKSPPRRAENPLLSKNIPKPPDPQVSANEQADQQKSHLAEKLESDLAAPHSSSLANEPSSEKADAPPRPVAEQQNSDPAQERFCEKADQRASDLAASRARANAQTRASDFANPQASELAVSQISASAQTPSSEEAEALHRELTARKADPADLLIQALAASPQHFPQMEQFRQIASTHKKKVNQGITLPESLFAIYKVCALHRSLQGEKTTMGDLMARALIRSLTEEILPELFQETKEQ